MRKSISNISLTAVIAIAFLLTACLSPSAEAKNRGSTGDSEGGTNTNNYVFMAAGVAVIAGVTVYLFTKDKEDDQEDEPEHELEDSASLESSIPIDAQFASGQESIPDSEPAEKPAVNPFIGLNQEETITVGVSFSF